MVTIQLTHKQVIQIKQALDHHLDGFSEEDAPAEWKEVETLRNYFLGILKQQDFNRQATIEAIQQKLNQHHGKTEERRQT